MTLFILTFIIISFLVAGMAIGVIVANKPIKGSCGGMSAIGIDTECDICGGDPKKCEEENAGNEDSETNKNELAYDASQTTGADKQKS